MIYLSKFMYEVYGVKRRKKLQFQGYIQKQKNCQGTHFSASMKYFGLYENILLDAIQWWVIRLDQQTVRRLLRPPTQDVSGQETVGKVGFLASFLPVLYSIETN